MKVSICDLTEEEYVELKKLVASGKALIISVGFSTVCNNYGTGQAYDGVIIIKE